MPGPVPLKKRSPGKALRGVLVHRSLRRELSVSALHETAVGGDVRCLCGHRMRESADPRLAPNGFAPCCAHAGAPLPVGRASGCLRRSLQRDDRQMPGVAAEVDLQREAIAGLAGNERTRGGAG
jgi:hypothetical protein